MSAGGNNRQPRITGADPVESLPRAMRIFRPSEDRRHPFKDGSEIRETSGSETPMTFYEAEAIALNPRTRSVKRLLRAAARLLESGRPSDFETAREARDRALKLSATPSEIG